MTVTMPTPLSPDSVTASFVYSLRPTDGKQPWVELNPVAGEPKSNIERESVQHSITNVRGKEAEYELDDAGFKFIKHETSCVNFQDDEEIKRVYYPESIELIKKHTGARRVILFNHTIRRSRESIDEKISPLRQPASLVHVDQTPQATIDLVHTHAPEIAEELLKHRVQVLNLWRPINNPASDMPLGLCDYRSFNWERDLITLKLVYPNSTGETFMVANNPAHKWYYLKGMAPNEAVLFKCAESRTDVARVTPHSAFKDPTTPADAPQRESIELRALVFYDDLPVDV